MAPAIDRIGVLTGGGDAPGLNAVIRAVVKAAFNYGVQCVGLEDSFDGLIEADRWRVLTPRDVTGILRLGGTILGTTNRGNPFAYPVTPSEGTRDYSDRVVEMFHKMGVDALVVIGGDGTLAIAHRSVPEAFRSLGCRRRSTTTSLARRPASASIQRSRLRPTPSIACTRPPRRTNAFWWSK
jgi:6-phosphofructokinase